MKTYKKKLKSELIAGLNQLYRQKGSWWQTIVDDDQVFIMVRDNHLRAQVHGGLLLMITMDRNEKIVCKTHEEYLNLRTGADPYVSMMERETAPPKRVEGLIEFVRHYEKIKRRIKLFAKPERQFCHSISLNIKEIVDKEVGLVLEKDDTNARNKAQFVDLQAVADDGKMVFVEAKLFGNLEIRSMKTPPVVKQLQKYQDIVKFHGREIIQVYGDQCETYAQLEGKFFQKRLPDPSSIKIHPNVRLIITGFDSAQRKLLLPGIRECIEKAMGWENNSGDLITVGNPNNIHSVHIFKGL